MERTHELGSDAHVASTDIIGGSLEWPYELAPGTTAEDAFLIHMNDDIPAQLAKLGFPDAATLPAQARQGPRAVPGLTSDT